jgi:hypothetical protein
MKTIVKQESIVIALVVSVALGLCGCCGETRSNDCDSLELHPIYASTLAGALIGGIVGYQSDEATAGAAVGAVIFGVGEWLHEMDEAHKDKEREQDECLKEVVVEIHNDNGSITPVRLRRKDCAFIGPKGERYEEMPTEEQLKPIYGLK